MSGQLPVIKAAIGDYPHTRPLKSGAVTSEKFALEFADIPVISRAFAPMIRQQAYDVSEMAIATFCQARAYKKPLILLPVVLAARFQQSALLCRADSAIRGPADLAGKRIGVRAYSQTTGVWIRGILGDEYSVKPETIRWTTFEGAHVAEYADPPFVERAAAGKDLLTMLKAREIDAAIFGNDTPSDPELRCVFSDVAASSESFRQKHGFIPVNHMMVVRAERAERDPELIPELMRLFGAARAEANLSAADASRLPVGCEAITPALRVALRYTSEQGLLPHPLTVDDLWAGLPPEYQEQ